MTVCNLRHTPYWCAGQLGSVRIIQCRMIGILFLCFTSTGKHDGIGIAQSNAVPLQSQNCGCLGITVHNGHCFGSRHRSAGSGNQKSSRLPLRHSRGGVLGHRNDAVGNGNAWNCKTILLDGPVQFGRRHYFAVLVCHHGRNGRRLNRFLPCWNLQHYFTIRQLDLRCPLLLMDYCKFIRGGILQRLGSGYRIIAVLGCTLNGNHTGC